METQKENLKNYQKYVKEYRSLSKRYDKLQERLANVDVVAGKVQMSSHSFPYVQSHLTVEMKNPKEAESIKQQMKICERRMERLEEAMLSAELFVESLADGIEKTIIGLVLLDGETQTRVAQMMHYSQGRISQIVSKVLND